MPNPITSTITPATNETWETPTGFTPVYEQVPGHEHEISYYRRTTEEHAHWQAEEVITDPNTPISYYLSIGHYGKLPIGEAYKVLSQVIDWANRVRPADSAPVKALAPWVYQGACSFTSIEATTGSVAALDLSTGRLTVRVFLDNVPYEQLRGVVGWLRDFFTVANGSTPEGTWSGQEVLA